MKLKSLAVLLVALIAGCSGETDKKADSEQKSQFTDILEKEVKVIDYFDGSACNLDIKFKTKPASKSQVLKLDANNSLEMNQLLATKGSSIGAKIASNVICQKLIGENKYTGTDAEWAQFIKQALEGMKRSGVTNLRLELTGQEAYVYNGELDNKEYKILGEFKGGKQVFHNLVLLDKANNIAYTVTVSGFHKAEKEIEAEFVRLIEMMKMNT